MLIIPRLVVATFFSTFVSAEVKVESHGKGLRKSSLDETISNHQLLFQTNVSSKLDCASACIKDDSCVAFSTSPTDPPSKKVACRGHDSRFILQSSTVDAPGSKTYFMENRPLYHPESPTTASSCLEYPCAPYSNWLGLACSKDNDCPPAVAHVVCRSSLCLCEPGYYYSYSSDGCRQDCASNDLQTMFLKYPGYHLLGNNMEVIDNCDTPEMGLMACLENPLCRTVDVYGTLRCKLQSLTALDDPSDFVPASPDHYQRTCA